MNIKQIESSAVDENNLFSIQDAIYGSLGKAASKVSSKTERFIVIADPWRAVMIRVRWFAYFIPYQMAGFFFKMPFHKYMGYTAVYSVGLHTHETPKGERKLPSLVWSRRIYEPIKSKLKRELEKNVRRCGIHDLLTRDYFFYDTRG